MLTPTKMHAVAVLASTDEHKGEAIHVTANAHPNTCDPERADEILVSPVPTTRMEAYGCMCKYLCTFIYLVCSTICVLL